MGFPNIGNGEEQLLPGRYEIICQECGYVFRVLHLIVSGQKSQVRCDNCGRVIKLNNLLNTPFIRRIN